MDNRTRLRKLVERHELTQQEVVDIIADETGDQVTKRAVQHWLGGTRPCPGWVLRILKLHLEG